jgi:hypothetical protein
MNVTVNKIVKGKDGKVYVSLNYPGALNIPSLVFESLPSEVGIEFFKTTSKRELDRMRGAPNRDEEENEITPEEEDPPF